MKEIIRKWRRPALFISGGALVGFTYYYFIGCTSGSCPIASNPIISMIYMGIMGWLMSVIFEKRIKEEE